MVEHQTVHVERDARAFMRAVAPSHGSWAEWADLLDTDGRDGTAAKVADIASDGIREPVVVGNDARLIDGHLRVAAALVFVRWIPYVLVDGSGSG